MAVGERDQFQFGTVGFLGMAGQHQMVAVEVFVSGVERPVPLTHILF